MNFVKYALASMAVVSFAACSENEEWVNQSQSDKEEGYMSLSIEMPNVGTTTRSNKVEGDGLHSGTAGEQQITSIDVWVYDENGLNPFRKNYKGSELIPQAPNPVQPTYTTTYTLPPFQVSAGNKKVVVVVNPLESKFGTALATLTDMQKATELTPQEIESISTDSKFMMTNSNQSERGDGAVAVKVEASNNIKNPAIVEVEVERVVAKIEDLTPSYTFEVQNSASGLTSTKDQVKFTDVALINGNQFFFPIKKVKGNYVVDPNFESQPQVEFNKFYANDFNTFPATDGKTVKALQDKQSACFYTLENTMTAKEQMNAYTTGMYYKAVYTLAGKQTGINIYQFAGKLYDWATFEKAAPELGLNLTIPGEGIDAVAKTLNDDSTQDEFDQIGVKKYVQGICYYPYWIRHIDNLDPSKMGEMEFAVVRNNYYQMNIHTVKSIGEYKPVTPDPNTPDELTDSYLDVKVKVMPWIVRKNNIDF